MRIIILMIIITFAACKKNFSNKTNQNDLAYTKLNIKDTLLQKSIKRGAIIYEEFCTQCHLENGLGVKNTFPPLAHSNWLSQKREATIHATKFGLKGPIEVNGKKYNGVMAPMGLTHNEVADVLNYVMNSWGNIQYKKVTPEEVAAIKKEDFN